VVINQWKNPPAHLSIGKRASMRQLGSVSADPIPLAIATLVTFMIGGIPFGLLAGFTKGVDLRHEGSGNIGATNAYRVLGKGHGIAVFILDFLKGFLPVCLAGYLLSEGSLPPDLVLVVIGLAAVLGHNFSPFLGFKGGKGMATTAGILLAWFPIALAICLGVWLLTFLISRYVSLASILASVALPVATLLTVPDQMAFIVAAFLLGAMGIWKHRSNIRRLKEGTEHRFAGKKEPRENDG
jgi:glycerol-3-phosphate acyltransferase PlsY